MPLSKLRKGETLTAKHIMVTKLVTLKESQGVYEAIELLRSQRISGAPVVGDDNRLLGILSELDCIRAMVHALYDRLPSVEVKHAMTTSPKTVSPNADVLTVANIFLKSRFRRVPVVENDILLGQISRRDVLYAISQAIAQTPQHESTVLYLSALEDHPASPLD